MSDFHHITNLIPQSKFEMVTDTASVVAIASPWWLPLLKETSEVAAYVLPILGVVWIATQIGWKWYREIKSKD
jgi:hypothetical protein